MLSASVMVGVQPLASQYRRLFDSPADAHEDGMTIPSSSLKQQELSAKVKRFLAFGLLIAISESQVITVSSRLPTYAVS